jgi:hypothetical protein
MNYTVRLGRKYYDNLKPGQDIVIIGPNQETQNIHIRELIKCNFEGLAPYVYQNEHDPDCRNKEGLIKALQAAYRKAFDVTKNPELTCIGFILI